MKIYTLDEALKFLNDIKISHIRLLNTDKKDVLIPYNARGNNQEQRIEQIKKFFSSKSHKDGVYYIGYLVGSNRKSPKYLPVKKETNGQLSDEAVNKVEETTVLKVEQSVMSNEDVFNLRVQNEKLNLENENLKNEIKDLEEEIEDLQKEPETLEDNVENKMGWFKELKDVIPSLADGYFQNEKEKREIERAKLGLMKQQFDAKNLQPQQQPKKQQEITAKDLIELKETNPKDFYIFYNENKELVEHILNEYENE